MVPLTQQPGNDFVIGGGPNSEKLILNNGDYIFHKGRERFCSKDEHMVLEISEI